MNRALGVVLCAALMAGCAGAPSSELGPPIDPRTVYVAAHGMHTGLIVRARDVPPDAWPVRADFPLAEYLELGWGDREYYMHPDPGLLLGLRALLSASPGAIHVVAFDGPIAHAFPGSEIIELQVSRTGFERMVAFVRESHELDAAGRGVVLGPGERAQSRFYASTRRFHLFETCNTWVARALREAGLPIDPGNATTAGALLGQVRALPRPPQTSLLPDGDGERLALVDHEKGDAAQRAAAGIAHVMRDLVGTLHEVSSFQFTGRLSVGHRDGRAFLDVEELLSVMEMLWKRNTGTDFHVQNHDLFNVGTGDIGLR